MDDIKTFPGIDITLFVLFSNMSDPGGIVTIWILHDEGTPLRHPVAALQAFFLFIENEGEGEVNIRVRELRGLPTGGAFATGIFTPVLTIQVLRKGQGHWQVATAFRAEEQLSMADTVVPDTFP